MTLTYQNDRFEALNAYDAREVLKENGFKWDGNVWWTVDVETAAQFLHVADDSGSMNIYRLRALNRASFDASRATAAAFEVPCPQGINPMTGEPFEYMPFQKAYVQYAAGKMRVLCADDMGVGKTVENIGWWNHIVITERVQQPRLLIVCQASALLHWKRHLELWQVIPQDIAIVTDCYVFPTSPVVIMNYEKLAYHALNIRAVDWDLVIVDEAHNLMHTEAIRTQCVYGEAESTPPLEPLKCKRFAALTGTPMRNRVEEMWPTLHYIDPVMWGEQMTYPEFMRRYRKARRTKSGKLRVEANQFANLDELQAKLRSTVMIRRLKKEVFPEFAKLKKRRQVIELPLMTASIRATVQEELEAWKDQERKLANLRQAVEQAKKRGDDDQAYAAAVAALKKQVSVSFKEMSAFRKRTALAKLPYVIQHLEDSLADGRKIVCFAHHDEVIESIKKHFGDLAVVVHGPTPVMKRQGLVDQFQQDPDVRLMIGGILVAGTIYTMTASEHVVFAELDWVPGNLSQAEDRVYRKGTKNSVLIQHLFLEGSLDANIGRKVVAKQNVIDKALNDAVALQEKDPIFDSRVQRDASTTKVENSVEEASNDADKTPASGSPRPSAAPSASRGPSRGAKAQETSPQTPSPAPNSTQAPAPATDGLAAISAALRVISSNCDGAHDRDGHGFSKFDADFGKKLASVATLSPKQAAYGKKLVLKYHRQVPDELLAKVRAYQEQI